MVLAPPLFPNTKHYCHTWIRGLISVPLFEGCNLWTAPQSPILWSFHTEPLHWLYQASMCSSACTPAGWNERIGIIPFWVSHCAERPTTFRSSFTELMVFYQHLCPPLHMSLGTARKSESLYSLLHKCLGWTTTRILASFAKTTFTRIPKDGSHCPHLQAERGAG